MELTFNKYRNYGIFPPISPGSGSDVYVSQIIVKKNLKRIVEADHCMVCFYNGLDIVDPFRKGWQTYEYIKCLGYHENPVKVVSGCQVLWGGGVYAN